MTLLGLAGRQSHSSASEQGSIRAKRHIKTHGALVIIDEARVPGATVAGGFECEQKGIEKGAHRTTM